MNKPYPLLFTSLADPFERKSWGGSRLVELLKKDLPGGVRIGESWDISDYPGAETCVLNGPLAGTSLHHLVETMTDTVVGDPTILQGGRFPLLVKYIDANHTLSVQVHPSDEYASEHENPGVGKKEAWYIMHVEPGAKLIRGVTPGSNRENFAEAIAKGELDPRLHTIEPSPGDIILIPWGMVHAIGAGIVLAEIQQTSDITYRVYDWNRANDHGEPRRLHIEKALDVIDFKPPAADTCKLRPLEGNGPSKRFEAVRCDKFVIETIKLAGRIDDAPPPGRFLILNVVKGDALLEANGDQVPLPFGSTVLIPAALPGYTLQGDGATVLRSYVP